MKKIGILILSIIALITVTSCSPMIYSDYVVESYGVPYYSGNVLVYYQYQNLYYYPYYHNGVCRYRVYRKPLHHHTPPTPRYVTRPRVTPPRQQPNVRPNTRPNVTQPPRRPTTTTTPNRPNVTRPTTPPRRNTNVTRFGNRR